MANIFRNSQVWEKAGKADASELEEQGNDRVDLEILQDAEKATAEQAPALRERIDEFLKRHVTQRG